MIIGLTQGYKHGVINGTQIQTLSMESRSLTTQPLHSQDHKHHDIIMFKKIK